jgi:hypothetical protein
MRSITIASNVSGLESSRERFLAKHSTSPERTHPAVRAGFMEFLSVICGLFADFDPPQTFADEKEMSGRWWWASVASKASACNAISRAHYLHLMQSCRVGLRDPYPPHGQAPDLACDVAAGSCQKSRSELRSERGKRKEPRTRDRGY